MGSIEKISQWLVGKPLWWNHAIRLALHNGELSQDHLNEVFRLAKMEHSLVPQDDSYDVLTREIDFSGYISEKDTVTFKSMSDIKGVAALAADQTLSFSENGLTIVFGENGAGKSSYASILKNACLTRGEIPQIVGNVFDATDEEPCATLTLRLNGEDETHVWSKDNPISEQFKSIRIFDSASALHYVDKEDSLGFKPPGLNLLTELTKSINSVKDRITEDIMPGNGLIEIPKLESSSEAALFVNNISADSDPGLIAELSASLDDLQRIEPLKQQIARNKLQSVESVRDDLTTQKKVIEPLKTHIKNILDKLGDGALEQLLKEQNNAQEKQKIANQLREATLEGLPFDHIAEEQWQKMWDEARAFIQNQNQTTAFPPEEGERCPLCLQDVTEKSSEQLRALDAFIADDAAKEARIAANSLKSKISNIDSLSFDLTPYEAALDALELYKVGLKESISSLNQLLFLRKESITSTSIPESVDALDINAFNSIIEIIANLQERIENLSSDEDLTSLIAKQEEELSLLEDKRFVSEQQYNIDANIKRHKEIALLKRIKSQSNTQQISTLSSSIYKDSVVAPLVLAFNNELKAFGFNRFSVNVQSRNKSGQQQFKLEVADSGEPVVANVASEGEQRCIAIASFLAEMKADSRQSAVVFDDPVNSLSHKWSARVAGRMIEESLERQVIIFTHDIVFFKLLLEAAEGLHQDNVNSIVLERSRTSSGLVRNSAPWEALTTGKRIKALNVELQALIRIDKDGTETEFRHASMRFYSLLREAWERLVEEKLLNKVVNRFDRGVHTQRLSRLGDLCQDDFDRVDKAMSKCSTYFTGHDSAPAVGAVYPTIEEVADDFGEIKKFLDELQNQRKRN